MRCVCVCVCVCACVCVCVCVPGPCRTPPSRSARLVRLCVCVCVCVCSCVCVCRSAALCVCVCMCVCVAALPTGVHGGCCGCSSHSLDSPSAPGRRLQSDCLPLQHCNGQFQQTARNPGNANVTSGWLFVTVKSCDTRLRDVC